jgi:cell division transport system permease protein
VSAFFHQLVYFARTALRGLRASPVTSAVSIATIAVAVIPLGGLLVITGNMRALLDAYGRERHLTAFLDPQLADAQAEALARHVGALAGVAHVELVSREQALERFRKRLGGSALLEALEENPLPASLEIALRPEDRSAERVRAVAAAIEKLPGVDEVAGGETWIEGYARALALVRGAGAGLGAVLAFATLLVVANTIRLAVYARRDELEILALVGASRTFMRTPFLIEGVVQGALGGAIGLALLYGAFRVVVPQLGDALELFLGWSDPSFLSARGMGLLIGGGAAFGLVGAAIAVARTRIS